MYTSFRENSCFLLSQIFIQFVMLKFTEDTAMSKLIQFQVDYSYQNELDCVDSCWGIPCIGSPVERGLSICVWDTDVGTLEEKVYRNRS